jgi:hypothetical protein
MGSGQALKALLRPDYLAIWAFSAKEPIDFRPLSRNPCIVCQKARPIIGHCVNLPFVFIHISGSTFIFNIFIDQRPVSDLEKHIREPPQLAQAGIFHSLHERRVHQSGVSLLPTAFCLLPTVLWVTPTRCIRPRPCTSASGYWP